MTMSLKVLSIGNALVDIIARLAHEDLAELGIAPGGMTLVDAPTSRRLYERLRNARAISGGSAANTASIAASLGADVAYAGKVAGDALGDVFRHDMHSQGIEALIALDTTAGAHTGNCLSLITPDAQRTMCTHLGAAQSLAPEDVPGDLAGASIVFLEGYLLDAPHGRDIYRKVVAAKPKVLALTLSDARCVARHLGFFQELLDSLDLVFGNAEEMAALFPGHHDVAGTAQAAARRVQRVVCTDGPNGVYVGQNGAVTHMPAHKVQVVDTTGAGDSLAGTVLWALAAGHGLEQGTRLALRVAAEVISEIGARPSRDIAAMLRDEGYLT
jgi:sugar/nucleoside kinase (ribokinase family)